MSELLSGTPLLPLESARIASREGRLKSWILDYLETDGANRELAEGVRYHARFFIGPIQMDLGKAHRIAGPEVGMLYKPQAKGWSREDWERTVAAYERSIKEGSQLPPLIVADFIDGGLAVADGNKRYEALRRATITNYWSVLCLKNDPRRYTGRM